MMVSAQIKNPNGNNQLVATRASRIMMQNNGKLVVKAATMAGKF